MRYLYGSKKGGAGKLVATFGSEQQLLAYVRWATLQSTGERSGKFEQGSVLAGYDTWHESTEPMHEEDASQVMHNPSPNMM